MRRSALKLKVGGNLGDLREVSNILWNTVKFAPQGSPEIGKWEVGGSSSLGEPPKQIFGKSWDFGPTGLTPPPLPERWDSQKGRKQLFCILGHSEHIIFS